MLEAIQKSPIQIMKTDARNGAAKKAYFGGENDTYTIAMPIWKVMVPQSISLQNIS